MTDTDQSTSGSSRAAGFRPEFGAAYGTGLKRLSELPDTLRVTVSSEGNKYTVIQDAAGRTRALRYGKEWRDCVGDNLVLALAYEVDALRTVWLVQRLHAGQAIKPLLCRSEEEQFDKASALLVEMHFEKKADESARDHVAAYWNCFDVHNDTEDDTAGPEWRLRYVESTMDFDKDKILLWDLKHQNPDETAVAKDEKSDKEAPSPAP